MTLTDTADDRVLDQPTHPDGPCPECADGVVLVADQLERETGHTPAWCSARCGWTS